MTNNPILPIVPGLSASLDDDDTPDNEKALPTNDDHLDEGETNDDQDTVEEDLRETDDVNEKLDE